MKNHDNVHTSSRDPYSLDKTIASSPLLHWHRSICQIESITNNEYSIGDFLNKSLPIDFSLNVILQDVPQEPDSGIQTPRYNVIAWPKEAGSKPHPKVILSSHIDTVPPHIEYAVSYPEAASDDNSNASPSTFNRSNILISGRGTVDDKACNAVQLFAATSLLASGQIKPTDIAFVFVVGEEKLGDGMRFFSNSSLHQHLATSYHTVIFGEPTELHLASGHKGIILIKIEARGKAAHSGYPWLGRSANSLLLKALYLLDNLGEIPPEEGGLPRSEKYGKSTVNIGKVTGGVAANVVAERAVAEVAIRIAGGTADEVVRIVTEAVKGEAVDPGDDITLTFSNGYGPVDIDSDVPTDEDKDFFGEPITVNYGTDIPNLKLKEGVKRCLYGPGSILVAHGDNEALTVGHLETSVEGYKRLILNALKDD